jgi:hypothetical protein
MTGYGDLGTDASRTGRYRRCRVIAQSTWKKSVASSADAWVCRNFRHVMSERRSGAGGIFSALRARRIVDAPAPVAGFEQFALDPLVSPGVVLGGEPADECGDLGADRRPSCPVRIGPLAGDQAAVPAQDGAGSDEPVCSQLSRQEPDQRGEKGAVGPVEPVGPGNTARRVDLRFRRMGGWAA